jgi:hypothetical protein
MLKKRTAYQEIGAAKYDQRERERQFNALQRKAAKLGVDVLPKSATEPVPSEGF